MFTQKLANKFLVFIYEIYTEKNGESISRLKFERFRVDDPIFYKFVTENTDIQADKEQRIFLTTLIMDLHSRGCIKKTNMLFNIEPFGVTSALKIKHPVIFFIRT